jgi:hypothetical protein
LGAPAFIERPERFDAKLTSQCIDPVLRWPYPGSAQVNVGTISEPLCVNPSANTVTGFEYQYVFSGFEQFVGGGQTRITSPNNDNVRRSRGIGHCGLWKETLTYIKKA